MGVEAAVWAANIPTPSAATAGSVSSTWGGAGRPTVRAQEDRCLLRCHLRRQALSLEVHRHRPIESFLHLDPGLGIAHASGTWLELEVVCTEPHGVVRSHRAVVHEAADLLHIAARFQGTIGASRLACRDPKLLVVPDEEGGQEAVGLSQGRDVREPKFGHQTILQGPKEAFDPSFRLGRVGRDRPNVEGLECPTHLGGGIGGHQLLLHGQLLLRRWNEDAMSIMVDRNRTANSRHELAEQQQIP